MRAAAAQGSGEDAVFVSIVICTRNRCTVLDRCLASIAGTGDAVDAEILVVDNGSTDATAATVEAWTTTLPSLRYVHEPRTGLSNARNTALEHARGDVLAFLDDDVLIDIGWLDGLVAAYRRWPDVAGVAGRVELSWPDGRPAWLPVRREVWFARLDLGAAPRLLAEHEYPVGANMSVRRDLAISAGGFDPALGYSGGRLLGNEERDFFDRVRHRGAALAYEPSASVSHTVEGAKTTRRYLVRRLYDQGRSDARVAAGAGLDGRRSGFSVAGRALSRGLLRGWRSDVRRIAQPGGREQSVVDIVAGRAKQVGMAHEALITSLLPGRGDTCRVVSGGPRESQCR